MAQQQPAAALPNFGGDEPALYSPDGTVWLPTNDECTRLRPSVLTEPGQRSLPADFCVTGLARL